MRRFGLLGLLLLLSLAPAKAGEPEEEPAAVREAAAAVREAHKRGELDEFARSEALRAVDLLRVVGVLLAEGEHTAARSLVDLLQPEGHEALVVYLDKQHRLDEFAVVLSGDVAPHSAASLRAAFEAQEIDAWRVACRALTRFGLPASMRVLPMVCRVERDALARYLKGHAALDSFKARLERQRLAELLLRGGRREDANALLSSLASGGDPLLSAAALEARAWIFVLEGNIERALDIFHEAAEAARSIGWAQEEVRLLYYEGYAAFQALLFDRGVLAWTAEAELHGRRDDELRRCQALQNVASVQSQSGQYARSRDTFRRALDIASERGWTGEIASCQFGLGLVAVETGHSAEGLQALGRAREAFRAVDDLPQLNLVLMYLGVIEDRLGNAKAAHTLLEGAITFFRAKEMQEELCLALGNLATVQWREHEFDDAWSSLKEVLELSAALELHAIRARTLSNAGIVQASRGKLEAARRLHAQAIEASRAARDLKAQCGAHVNAGTFERRHGSAEKAREHLDRALDIAQKLRLPRQMADALHQAAQLDLSVGDVGAALGHWREAIGAMPSLFQHLDPTGGAFARQTYREVFAEALATAFEAVEASPELAKTAYWFAEAARAGSLRESLTGRDAILKAALPLELVEQEKEAQRRLSLARHTLLLARASDDLLRSRDAATALQAAKEELKGVIGRIRAEQKQVAELVYPEPADAADVCGALRPTEALVVYVRLDARLVALVLTRAGIRVASPEDSAMLDAHCAEVARQLRPPNEEAPDPVKWKESVDALRAMLIEPLSLGDGIRTLLIAPTGPLYDIPFSVLVPTRRVWLVSSATVFHALRTRGAEAGSEVFALGNPHYDLAERHRPLDSSLEEVRAIGDVVVVGKDATEERLLEAFAREERWRAVHVSCHGVASAEDPLASRLLLASPASQESMDGQLSAADVYRLEVKADLVTLGACETGAGVVLEMEGLLGLPRAFLVAGAPRVLASLCRVDDRATTRLMIEFYKRWNPRDGAPPAAPADALAKAQDEVRKTRKWKPPHYWAPWVLWGVPP